MKRGLLVLAALIVLASAYAAPAFAQSTQSGTVVTIAGQRGDAGSRLDSASAATLTTQAPTGALCNYITMIGVFAMASGVPTAATPTATTLTGIAGTSPKLRGIESVFPAAGAQGSVAGAYVPLTTPLKCTSGTACAIVPPTAVTNFPIDIYAAYYPAPC